MFCDVPGDLKPENSSDTKGAYSLRGFARDWRLPSVSRPSLARRDQICSGCLLVGPETSFSMPSPRLSTKTDVPKPCEEKGQGTGGVGRAFKEEGSLADRSPKFPNCGNCSGHVRILRISFIDSLPGCQRELWWLQSLVAHVPHRGGISCDFSLFCVADKVENQCFVGGFMVLTLFALFVPDLDLLLGTVETQQLLSSSAQMIRAISGYFGGFSSMSACREPALCKVW